MVDNSLPPDDRVFVNAVPLTEEQKAANAAHFASKGYQVEVADPNEKKDDPAPATPAATPEAPAAPENTQPPAETPALDLGANEPVDEETRAEWQAAPTEGERLGRIARKNRELKTLRETTQRQAAELEELRKKVNSPAPEPAAPPAPLSAAPAAPAVETPTTEGLEAPKPIQEFAEAEPEIPVFANFADEDDPVTAHQDAIAKWNKDVRDYDKRKAKFESDEQTRFERETREFEERQARAKTEEQVKTERYQKAVSTYADFSERTNSVGYSPVLRFLLNDELADGLELAYHLADPQHAEVLKSINDATVNAKTPAEINRALLEAAGELAVFRKSLKATQTGAPPATPAAPANPPAATSQAAPPAPPVAPRREDPAPIPINGRGAAPVISPTDVDPMDSDRRRELRRLATV